MIIENLLEKENLSICWEPEKPPQMERISGLQSERILAWVELSGWERSVDVLYAEQVQSLEEDLADMLEGVCTMVREALLYQDVTIETCEAWNSSDADATERAWIDVEEVTLCDVADELSV